MTTIEKLAKADKNTLFVTKKDGSLLIRTKNALSYCLEKTNTCLHYSYWTGRGRNKNLVDYSAYILTILGKLGYKYTMGKDAPRGGQHGNYIKISKTALNALNSLIEN